MALEKKVAPQPLLDLFTLESALIVLLISKILKTFMYFVYVYRTILLEIVQFFTVFIPSKSVRHGDTWRYIMIYSSKSRPTTLHFFFLFCDEYDALQLLKHKHQHRMLLG